MRARKLIDTLRANGRYSFTRQAAEEALELQPVPVLNALRRLKQNKQIVSPAKGFYLIVPPEYQAFGCLPAEMFISDLMKYLNLPYYVGYLSAAQYYGAAHQKPQQFQVVTSKRRRPIRCGRVLVTFITSKNVERVPTQQFNTSAGYITVATPEAIAADLISFPQYGAGINNVATVLKELSESMDAKRLIALTTTYPEKSWIQRLGYLLEFLGINELANKLAETLIDKKLYWVPLVAHAPYQNLTRHKKWKIIVNTEVEPDL